MKRIFQSKIFFSFFIFAVIILLIFLQAVGALKPLDEALTFIFNPITRSFYGLGMKTNQFFEKRETVSELEQENQQLKDQINNLLIEQSKLITQKDSLIELKEQLKFIQEKGVRSVSAQVIGLNITADSKTYIINRGTDEGLERGYPVIYKDGIMIGKIVEVEPKIAKFKLITDSLTMVSGEIQNETNSLGVVQGELGLSLKMTLIPQEDKIESNQLVVTSGLDMNFPRGLLIGRINKMTTQTGELFQSASLDPITSLNKITIVSIIIP